MEEEEVVAKEEGEEQEVEDELENEVEEVEDEEAGVGGYGDGRGNQSGHTPRWCKSEVSNRRSGLRSNNNTPPSGPISPPWFPSSPAPTMKTKRRCAC